MWRNANMIARHIHAPVKAAQKTSTMRRLVVTGTIRLRVYKFFAIARVTHGLRCSLIDTLWRSTVQSKKASRDAVSNLCQSDLNNGNAGLCDAIKARRTSAGEIPNMTASELRPGVHRPTPSRCCDDGSNTARATNLFECPRCSERKCTHYELQTRLRTPACSLSAVGRNPNSYPHRYP